MPRSLGNIRFDKENVSADRCPCQADDHAGAFHPLFDFFLELIFRSPEQLHNNLRCNDEFRLLPFQKTAGVFAADTGYLAFEISDASFARVMSDDEVNRLILKLNLIRLQSAVFATTGDQVISRDLNLLLLGVSRQFDHFHAVT